MSQVVQAERLNPCPLAACLEHLVIGFAAVGFAQGIHEYELVRVRRALKFPVPEFGHQFGGQFEFAIGVAGFRPLEDRA